MQYISKRFLSLSYKCKILKKCQNRNVSFWLSTDHITISKKIPIGLVGQEVPCISYMPMITHSIILKLFYTYSSYLATVSQIFSLLLFNPTLVHYDNLVCLFLSCFFLFFFYVVSVTSWPIVYIVQIELHWRNAPALNLMMSNCYNLRRFERFKILTIFVFWRNARWYKNRRWGGELDINFFLKRRQNKECTNYYRY